jgi:hypothetical protein
MESGPTITNPARCRCDIPFPQISTRNLDVPIVGQLPAANLPLGDEFEPGPVKMIGFEASFRRGGLWEQDLEHAPRDPDDAFILAHPDSELDGVSLGAPSGVRWEAEEHGPPGMFR